MGEYGLGAFQAALIPNGLGIISNLLKEIYTPRGYRGVGGYGGTDRGMSDILNWGIPDESRTLVSYLPVCGKGGLFSANHLQSGGLSSAGRAKGPGLKAGQSRILSGGFSVCVRTREST